MITNHIKKIFSLAIYKMRAKPFLKWAGGKSQLIDQIKDRIPEQITRQSFTYIEPFVGSGAIMFWILDTYPNVRRIIINDINTDLTECYAAIRDNIDHLIELLKLWEVEYHTLEDNEEGKKLYYYEKREQFNLRNTGNVNQSALFIFLNKTCFNGLYRVNKSNKFNVPMGRYKRPTICNEANLRAVSEVLQNVTILNGDYISTMEYATANTLFYFDPPYKPLSDTSSFNTYTKDEFGDAEQIRLKEFCDELNDNNYYWILSNSDLKGKNPDDNFFDDLYADFNINRVNAKRSINANATKRGELTELLITN